MATYSVNTTLKVNRAITGATTVNANCYAVVTYNVTSISAFSANAVTGATSNGIPPVSRYFGPSQSIPATFTSLVARFNGATQETANYTYSLQSGVEFINSP
jgi:hypothetical protein